MNRFNPQMPLSGGMQKWNAGRKKQDFSWFTPLFLLVLICVSTFLVMTYRVSYQQKTEQLNVEIQRMKVRRNRYEREIANLKFRREQLRSWSQIGKRVNALGLRQADPGQVRTMVLHGENRVRRSAAVRGRNVQKGRSAL